MNKFNGVSSYQWRVVLIIFGFKAKILGFPTFQVNCRKKRTAIFFSFTWPSSFKICVWLACCFQPIHKIVTAIYQLDVHLYIETIRTVFNSNISISFHSVDTASFLLFFVPGQTDYSSFQAHMLPSLNQVFISHCWPHDWYIHMTQYFSFIFNIRKLKIHTLRHCRISYFVEKYSVNWRHIFLKWRWLSNGYEEMGIPEWTKKKRSNFFSKCVVVLFYDVLQLNSV